MTLALILILVLVAQAYQILVIFSPRRAFAALVSSTIVAAPIAGVLLAANKGIDPQGVLAASAALVAVGALAVGLFRYSTTAELRPSLSVAIHMEILSRALDAAVISISVSLENQSRTDFHISNAVLLVLSAPLGSVRPRLAANGTHHLVELLITPDRKSGGIVIENRPGTTNLLQLDATHSFFDMTVLREDRVEKTTWTVAPAPAGEGTVVEAYCVLETRLTQWQAFVLRGHHGVTSYESRAVLVVNPSPRPRSAS